MSSTITSGANTINPVAVYEYETSQPARNIVHPILGRSNPDVTFRAAGTRGGILRMVFATESSANTARSLLGSVLAAWTLNNTDRTTINMTFAVTGDITLRIDRTGAYLLDVGYAEV